MANTSESTSATRQPHETWSNWPTFILAAAGSAVGLGNIWKFPYIMGEYGGGAFVLVYLVCIAAIGVPVMIAEVMIGRRGRLSPINSMRVLAEESDGSRRWGGVGLLATAAAFLILSFYSVIAGWAMPYVGHALAGDFNGASPDEIGGLFGGLLGSPSSLLLWHTLFMALTVFVSASGVRSGLERAVSLLMPTLFVLLVVLMIYGMTTGHFGDAMAFMFATDFSKLSAEAVLTAVGHAFFTLSLAAGSMMAYGSYLKSGTSIAGTSTMIAGLDTLVALMAGLAIFPIVFANGLEPGAGPGLVFQTLPLAFGKMTGGWLIGTLFFFMLVIAAWTSSISLLESLVEWLSEKGISRRTAAVAGGGAAWLLGVTTVLSLNVWSGFHPLDAIGRFEGMTLFDLYDYLTSNIMLPLGGLLTAVFAGWVLAKEASRDELRMGSWYGIWRLLIRYVAPAGIVAVFIANLS